MGDRKDYYKILGVDKNVSADDLKKVYRKLSLKYHPDRQSGKSDAEKKAAEEKFKDIAEAYDVLSDPKKKSEYDNPQSSFDFSGFGGGSPFDIFNEFFGGGGSSFNFTRKEAIQRGSNIRLNVSVTLEEIFSGVTKKLRYKRQEPCSTCGGSGKTAQTREETCSYCGGTGMIFQTHGNVQHMSTCPYCGGKGKHLINPCPNCNGKGLEVKDHEVEVEIPSGIPQGAQLVMQGNGSASPNGNKGGYGDLLIVINEKPHEKFERNGNDLYYKLEVPVMDAIVGGSREVETIDGIKLNVKIKQGIEDGTILRFAQKGMPIYNGRNMRGDMLIVVKLKMPKQLTNDEINILNELKEHENFK